MALEMALTRYAPAREQELEREPLFDSLVYVLSGLVQCWGPPPTAPKPAGLRISDRQWRRQSALIMALYDESP